MKLNERQYKQLCGKCEYLMKDSGKKVCPFVGCIKRKIVYKSKKG